MRCGRFPPPVLPLNIVSSHDAPLRLPAWVNRPPTRRRPRRPSAAHRLQRRASTLRRWRRRRVHPRRHSTLRASVRRCSGARPMRRLLRWPCRSTCGSRTLAARIVLSRSPPFAPLLRYGITWMTRRSRRHSAGGASMPRSGWPNSSNWIASAPGRSAPPSGYCAAHGCGAAAVSRCRSVSRVVRRSGVRGVHVTS